MKPKKKILFIVPHRLNRSPGQRFRFEQYLRFLEQNNFKYSYSYIISKHDDKIYYARKKLILKLMIVIKGFFIRMYDVARAGNYDILFIYREAFMLGWKLFENLFKKTGTKIIFDFDDAIWLNNISEGNEKLNWLKKPEKTTGIIKLADMIFAGNQYLANYAKKYNNNVKTMPTTIDTSYHTSRKNRQNNQVCIGWTGTSTTLEYFKIALPVLKEIYKKYYNKIYFKVIVDINYHEPGLDLTSTTWDINTEIEDLSEIDIGIMPLPDDEWAKGKCGFKGLQYMALEIPTIMSPVGVNTEIIKNGVNGFLASTTEEWTKKLSLLIDSTELREKIGKAGRKTVIEKYSFESQKSNYLEYFTELLEK